MVELPVEPLFKRSCQAFAAAIRSLPDSIVQREAAMKNGGAHRTPPFFFTVPRFSMRCPTQRMSRTRRLNLPTTYRSP
ncbi:hypothetical protein [Paraburkholderia ultramafica]|uniref:hypothetical protein n=1 Tax=Paraburkholderia ultramafica TaxID=1544867 RepID=UPI00158231C5|nr:hypothetical protein [Paraburkholderia ultramafica]